MQSNNGRFTFDGGAATYVGTGVLAFLITVCTLGFGYPFALVLRERWRAKHSYIDGRRLVFTGSVWGLFGNWVKWLLLCIVTLGIYSFWVGPRIARWKWEHTDFENVPMPATGPATGYPGAIGLGGPQSPLTPGYPSGSATTPPTVGQTSPAPAGSD